MADTILFDLDGTLTDPGLGITNSIMHALKKMSIPLPERQELYQFIGPPLMDSFHRHYGLDEASCAQAVVYYREYFSVTGLFENEVYPGIREMLGTLRQAGKKLVLATSKPELYARRILEHFALSRYFTHIVGATMDETRTAKHEVIAYALEAFGIDPAGAIMVGDREHDVLGARKNGLACVGVLYGYGSRRELTDAGAVALADSPEELLGILMEE